MADLFKQERDAIVTLGLLAQHYLTFDPPIMVGAGKSSHFRGFNVRAIVVDNVDGEVLAIGSNQIHQDEDPLQHAEQTAVRSAHKRLRVKRFRETGTSIEDYYKHHLFMQPGSEPSDFVRRGCTLYNTFDPCAMCAVTLLVCYMKRIAYLFDDEKFAAVYQLMKKEYFKGRESVKDAVLSDPSKASPFIERSTALLTRLREAVQEREHAGTPLVQTLDSCRELLAEGFDLFAASSASELITSGDDLRANARTLQELKRLANLG